MRNDSLEDILQELRSFRGDHQFVEAKASRRQLSSTIDETLSAFRNTLGGVILLGVDEANGAFDVVGLEDPNLIATSFQSVCAGLNPPLRPQIDLFKVEGNIVLKAIIPVLDPRRRPCFVGHDPYSGSFYRVGDADQLMTAEEVTEMMAGRSVSDESRRVVEGAKLDQLLVDEFIAKTSGGSPGDTDEVLQRWNATMEGTPTIAGTLVLGEEPAAELTAARIAYRQPSTTTGVTRFANTHLEGTVGALLESAIDHLSDDLVTIQVQRDGFLVDDVDIPAIVLREIVANALLHRSFTEGQTTANIVIELTSEAVVVTSPGCLHVGTSLSDLGISPISNVRNHTLVRICEKMTTPRGNRIVENQASGILVSDQACRERHILPPLFYEMPNRFQVYLIRGETDDKAAQALLPIDLQDDASAIRVVACLLKLESAHEAVPVHPLRQMIIDAKFIARLTGKKSSEAANLLKLLVEKSILLPNRVVPYPSWKLNLPTPEEGFHGIGSLKQNEKARINTIIKAIGDSSEGALSPKAIEEALNVSTPKSRSKWINKAADLKMIATDAESIYDPTIRYYLTEGGKAQFRKLASSQG